MKIIVEVLCILLVCTSPLYAQNIGDDNYYSSGSPSGSQLLPSEVYYNENIEVNVIASASPSAGESGGGFNPNDGWGNPELGAVDSPIGDYKYPLATFVIFYILYTLYFKNRRHI